MGKTTISWTDQTWNPVTGCSHVSEGCRNCYAEKLSLRFGTTKKPWTAQNAAENVTLHPARVDQPRHWAKPRMVFVNSMSDLFHPLVPFTFIDKVMNVIAGTPKHTFQVLTKRPKRMLEYFTKGMTDGGFHSLFHPENIHNLWLGVSVEDQATADRRIPLLLQCPAWVRFLSCEPLLGKIDFDDVPTPVFAYEVDDHSYAGDGDAPIIKIPGIDWVIVGGESGANFRKMQPEWAQSIRDQCIGAKVPFFFKQHSGRYPATNPTLDGEEWHQFPTK